MKMKSLQPIKPQSDSGQNRNFSVYTAMSDSDIWNRFLQGDGEAFNHIYVHFFPLLFNYGHHFCQDRELIKDVVQELFIYLKTKRKKLGKTDNIKFYLYKSLRRNLFRELTKKKSVMYVDELPSTADFEITLSHESLLIQNQEQAKLKEDLTKSVAKLSKRQKEAVIYYYYEGFSYTQVSELMGFSSVEYARKLIYRSLETLRKYVPNIYLLTLIAGLSVSL